MAGDGGRYWECTHLEVVLKDKSDKHLEDNEGGEQHVGDEEWHGDPRAAIAGFVCAVGGLGGGHCVVHEAVPVLASRRAEHGEHGPREGAKVRVGVDELAVDEVAEELHAEHGGGGEEVVRAKGMEWRLWADVGGCGQAWVDVSRRVDVWGHAGVWTFGDMQDCGRLRTCSGVDVWGHVG